MLSGFTTNAARKAVSLISRERLLHESELERNQTGQSRQTARFCSHVELVEKCMLLTSRKDVGLFNSYSRVHSMDVPFYPPAFYACLHMLNELWRNARNDLHFLRELERRPIELEGKGVFFAGFHIRAICLPALWSFRGSFSHKSRCSAVEQHKITTPRSWANVFLPQNLISILPGSLNRA